MKIQRNSNEIIVSFANSVDIQEIQRFLNYIRFKEIAAKSKATEADVTELANEVNASWWQANKNTYLPEG